MGMFDSVYVKCAKCGTEVEFQSKAGKCDLENYTINNAPPEILIDIDKEIGVCKECGHYNQIHVQVMTFATVG